MSVDLQLEGGSVPAEAMGFVAIKIFSTSSFVGLGGVKPSVPCQDFTAC
jgi:hypothetical protein